MNLYRTFFTGLLGIQLTDPVLFSGVDEAEARNTAANILNGHMIALDWTDETGVIQISEDDHWKAIWVLRLRRFGNQTRTVHWYKIGSYHENLLRSST